MIISKHRRTKIVRSHARKRVRKKAPPVQQPDAVVLSYSKLLLGEVKAMEELVNDYLLPKLNFLTTKQDSGNIVVRTDDIDVAAKIGGLFMKMKMKFFGEAGHDHEPKLTNYTKRITNAIVKPMLKRANDHNKRQFSKGMQTVLAVDPLKAEPFLRDQLALATKANVDLIKTIPQDYFKDIEGLVTHAARSGESIDTLKEKIMDRTGKTNNRCRLIARDQISKFNGSLHEKRASNNGILRYIWHTVKDSRVRDSHRHLEGEIFFWTQKGKDANPHLKGEFPPPEGHPGTPIQDRCYAENIWQDLLDVPVAASSEPKTQSNEVVRVEKDIRYKTDVERAVVVDSNGKILVDKLGDEKSVLFTPEDAVKMKGNILTHNHPTGSSFSPEDFGLAISKELKEIRAVGKEYKYSIKFNNKKIPGADGTAKAKKVIAEMNRVNGIVSENFWVKINNGEITIPEANLLHNHEVITKMANDPVSGKWFDYKRQKWSQSE